MQMRQVVAIHGQKIIEPLEVLPRDLAPTQSAQIVAAACSSSLRPGVGWIAYVIVEGASRIRHDEVRKSRLLDLMAEHALCRG